MSYNSNVTFNGEGTGEESYQPTDNPTLLPQECDVMEDSTVTGLEGHMFPVVPGLDYHACAPSSSGYVSCYTNVYSGLPKSYINDGIAMDPTLASMPMIGARNHARSISIESQFSESGPLHEMPYPYPPVSCDSSWPRHQARLRRGSLPGVTTRQLPPQYSIAAPALRPPSTMAFKEANSMGMSATVTSAVTPSTMEIAPVDIKTIEDGWLEFRRIRDRLNSILIMKTVLCPRMSAGQGHNWKRCNKTHGERNRRRPDCFMYSSTYCTKFDRLVKNWTCSKQQTCKFAHSKEEELYHPLKFRTQRCNNGPTTCPNRNDCPFFHTYPSPAELYPNLKTLLLLITDLIAPDAWLRGQKLLELQPDELEEFICIIGGATPHPTRVDETSRLYIRCWLMGYFLREYHLQCVYDIEYQYQMGFLPASTSRAFSMSSNTFYFFYSKFEVLSRPEINPSLLMKCKEVAAGKHTLECYATEFRNDVSVEANESSMEDIVSTVRSYMPHDSEDTRSPSSIQTGITSPTFRPLYPVKECDLQPDELRLVEEAPEDLYCVEGPVSPTEVLPSVVDEPMGRVDGSDMYSRYINSALCSDLGQGMSRRIASLDTTSNSFDCNSPVNSNYCSRAATRSDSICL